MRPVALPVVAALAAASLASSAAPAANRAHHRTYRDPYGDACCTEDITRVVVSNIAKGRITIRITAPNPTTGDVSTDYRDIWIATARGNYLIREVDDTLNYVLMRSRVGGGYTWAGHVRSYLGGTRFTFSITRRELRGVSSFKFRIEFGGGYTPSPYPYGPGSDFAPDAGTWSYRLG